MLIELCVRTIDVLMLFLYIYNIYYSLHLFFSFTYFSRSLAYGF